MRPVRYEVEKLLGRGKLSGNKRLVGMCRELYGHQEWLWIFTKIQGIERMLSVSETCRLQQRLVYDYLIQAVIASCSKKAPPSLLHTL